MKILFLTGSVGKTRHFNTIIKLFSDRGHTVRLCCHRRKIGPIELPDNLRYPSVSLVEPPLSRSDLWRGFAPSIRICRDYLRYFEPLYKDATRLRNRAVELITAVVPRFKKFCDIKYLRSNIKFNEAGLDFIEKLIPSDKKMESFLKSEKPDVILITPLVNFGSFQTDYIKAGHRLGIPVVFLPFSWDNLTTKGLMHVTPDYVLVWNETQKKEAITLHGMPEDNVIVCGAWRFDGFFNMKPDMTREELYSYYNLNSARPLVTYLCSSKFTFPEEVAFVKNLLKEIRSSDDELLKHCNIIVRPHPTNKAVWLAVDIADFKNVSIWDFNLDNSYGGQGLYDCLHYSSAVIGINTSAMIEAAILNKPVYTVSNSETKDAQGGTVHFSYLKDVGGGLLVVASNFRQLCMKLCESLYGKFIVCERSIYFTEAFVRPMGITVEVTPLVVDEIERIAHIKKKRKLYPFWFMPFEWLIILLLEFGLLPINRYFYLYPEKNKVGLNKKGIKLQIVRLEQKIRIRNYSSDIVALLEDAG